MFLAIAKPLFVHQARWDKNVFRLIQRWNIMKRQRVLWSGKMWLELKSGGIVVITKTSSAFSRWILIWILSYNLGSRISAQYYHAYTAMTAWSTERLCQGKTKARWCRCTAPENIGVFSVTQTKDPAYDVGNLAFSCLSWSKGHWLRLKSLCNVTKATFFRDVIEERGPISERPPKNKCKPYWSMS